MAGKNKTSVRVSPDPRLVSVILPTYNSAITLVEAVESVLKQTYPRWELLIVDDASHDATWAIASAMADNDIRIRAMQLPKNSGGPALPRNVGIQKARGDLVAFLDADDHWLPEKLTLQVEALLSSEAVISCTGYHVVNEKAHTIGQFVPPLIGEYDDLLKRNSMGCSTVLLDISRIGKRYFPPLGHEDYALWLSILREGRQVLGLPQLLSVYRIAPGSVSSNKLKVLGFFLRIYKDCEGFSSFKSLCYTLRYAFLARNKYRLSRKH